MIRHGWASIEEIDWYLIYVTRDLMNIYHLYYWLLPGFYFDEWSLYECECLFRLIDGVLCRRMYNCIVYSHFLLMIPQYNHNDVTCLKEDRKHWLCYIIFMAVTIHNIFTFKREYIDAYTFLLFYWVKLLNSSINCRKA